MLEIQRQVGNQATTSWITAQRNPIGNAKAPSQDQDQLPKWVVQVRDSLLSEGVKESELGDAGAIQALGEEQARSLLDKLHRYRTDKDLGFTSSSKIAKSWSNRRDDLGVMGRSGYPTILHYVQELDRLTRSSLGGGWPETLKGLKGSTIQLAGGTYVVHPRMLYFAAAGQIGMDIAAASQMGRIVEVERTEEEGHYVTPAAVFEELRLVRRAALAVDELAAQVEKEAAEAGVPPAGMEGAAAVYNNLAQRLRDVVALRRRQEADQASGKYGTGHPEPGIRRYVDDDMVDEIERLPPAAESDLEGVKNCREIMVTVWHRPQKKQAHGWGAADPHGSHHAMGMAMDVFYGTGSGGYANFAKFLTGEGVADAIGFLVERFGADYGFESSVKSPQELLSEIKTNPEYSTAFALLLRDHGAEALALLDQGVKESATDDVKKAIIRYTDLRRRIISGVRTRQARVAKLLGKRSWLRHQPELRALAKAIMDRATSRELVRHDSPAAFLKSAGSIAGEYEGLRVSIELIEGGSADALMVHPAAEPDLAGPLEELASAMEPVTLAWEANRRATIRRRMPPGLMRAIERASAGTLVIDQPTEVLYGLGAVQGASLQSWHHFQVRNWRGVLLSQQEYKGTLLADMRTRTPEEMRRILQVMAQSPPGYRAVFGDEEGRAGLASVRGALDTWAQELSARGESVDVDGLLKEVAERLPPPAMEGLSKTRKSLAADLYARGFYDVALIVAGRSGGGDD